jgi:hypothetical protein
MIFSFRVVAPQNYSKSPSAQKDQPVASQRLSEIKNNIMVARMSVRVSSLALFARKIAINRGASHNYGALKS